jgi:hypothetical protein
MVMWRSIQALLATSSLLAFLATLSVWLNGFLPDTYLAVVFIPMYVVEILQLVDTHNEFNMSAFKRMKEGIGEQFTLSSYVWFVTDTLILQVI